MKSIQEHLASLKADLEDKMFTDVRREAENAADDLLQRKLGNFTEEDIGEFSACCNTEFIPSKNKKGDATNSRFYLGFKGKNVKEWKNDTGQFSKWVKSIYESHDDGLCEMLNDFWANKRLKFAGTILPTMILYLKHRNSKNIMHVWTESLNLKLEFLSDKRMPFRRKFECYEQYNLTANKIMRDHNISIQQFDYVVSQVKTKK